MLRGEIWVTDGDREAFVLLGSDHVASGGSMPPLAWGVPLTAEPQPKRFAEPFVVSLSPTQSGLDFTTWVLVARGIRPLRHQQLTSRIGALTPGATSRLNDAVRLLYDL